MQRAAFLIIPPGEMDQREGPALNRKRKDSVGKEQFCFQLESFGLFDLALTGPLNVQALAHLRSRFSLKRGLSGVRFAIEREPAGALLPWLSAYTTSGEDCD